LGIRVEFSNEGIKEICLLRVFKPTAAFFDVALKSSTGQEILTTKPVVSEAIQAKLRNSKNLNYLDLQSDEAFSVQINASEFIPRDLQEGSYRITLTYHNEYGENCFKGTKVTEGVWLKIVDDPADDVEGSISQEKAIELANSAAIAAKIKINSEDKVVARNTAKQWIITFGSPPANKVPGADFKAKVYLDRLTGHIDQIEISA